MRQAGVLATAASALEHHVGRLKDDHENANRLAVNCSRYLRSRSTPRTSAGIVIFDVVGNRLSASAIVGALKQEGVLINAIGVTSFRASHLGCVDQADRRRGEALPCPALTASPFRISALADFQSSAECRHDDGKPMDVVSFAQISRIWNWPTRLVSTASGWKFRCLLSGPDRSDDSPTGNWRSSSMPTARSKNGWGRSDANSIGARNVSMNSDGPILPEGRITVRTGSRAGTARAAGTAERTGVRRDRQSRPAPRKGTPGWRSRERVVGGLRRPAGGDHPQ